MRPAQLTPENGMSVAFPARAQTGFNEAGAINAGKRQGKGEWSADLLKLQ